MLQSKILQRGFLVATLAAMFFMKITQGAPNYRIVIESLENAKSKGSDPYVKFHYLRSAKYNDTVHVLNAAATILKDIPLDATCEVTAYEKKNNNDYSLIPVKLGKSTVCKFVKEDTLFYEDIVAVGNMPRYCPFKAGNYTATDFIVRPNNMPDELPGERWRVDILVQTKKKEDIWRLSAYVYIDRAI